MHTYHTKIRHIAVAASVVLQIKYKRLFIFGGAWRIRTAHLLRAMQALYQMS